MNEDTPPEWKEMYYAMKDQRDAAQAELAKERSLIDRLEKFIWRNGKNHIVIAPYRIGKTDEKRIAIFNHDDAPLDNELGDGSTFRDAIRAAMNP